RSINSFNILQRCSIGQDIDALRPYVGRKNPKERHCKCFFHPASTLSRVRLTCKLSGPAACGRSALERGVRQLWRRQELENWFPTRAHGDGQPFAKARRLDRIVS